MISTDVLAAIGAGEPAEEASSPSALGRDEFLRMLIAQLENQDPLNPQDATQFTAQLAQFSSLEQLLSIGAGIEQLVESQGASRGLAALDLIGRDVIAESSQLAVGPDGAVLAQPLIALDEASTSTTVNVFDATGRLVRSLSLGALGQGEHAVAWDGRDAAGQPVAPGVYSFQVLASAGEAAASARTLVQGRVTGAVPGGEDPLVLLGDVVVPLSRVEEVRAPGAGS